MSTDKLSALEVIFTKISAAVNVQAQIGGSLFKGIANGLSSALAPAKALLATTGKFLSLPQLLT